MVGLGVAMIFIGAIGLILRLRGALYDHPLFLKASLLMGPSGLIAILAGWMVTEVGRQPYTVYGLLRTADSISPIAAPGVWGSLLALIFVYFLVFTPGIVYILRLMKKPPLATEH